MFGTYICKTRVLQLGMQSINLLAAVYTEVRPLFRIMKSPQQTLLVHVLF